MRKLLLATALVAATPAAAWESFTLWQGRFWQVAVVDNDKSGMYCRLTNERTDGDLFHFMVDADGWYSVMLIMPGQYLSGANITTDLVLRLRGTGRGDNWTLNDAEGDYYYRVDTTLVSFGFGYDPEQRGFVRDFMKHREFDVVGDDGRMLTNFSLRGSAEGIRQLDACRDRIARNY